MMGNKLHGKNYLLIFFTSFIVWLPIVFTSFINDDFQILGWHTGTGLFSLVKPFFTIDVSGYYWRPLGNALHTVTILLFGLNPLAFRLGNLLLLSLCSVLVAHTGIKLGFTKNTALISALIFSVLPSHDILVGWIAAKGEILVAILILLSVEFYYDGIKEGTANKKLWVGLIFFTLAVFVKELSFALVFIPFLFLFSFGTVNKINLKKALVHFSKGVIIIVLILLLRKLLLGNNPFASPHFSTTKPMSWLANIFFYFPLSFVSPEILETLMQPLNSLVLCIAFLVFFSVVIVLATGGIKNTIKDEFNKVIFSFLWFGIFIIPVAPVLMRWYPFTASIALVWLVIIIIEKNKIFQKIKYLGITLTVFTVIGLGIYDFIISLNWYQAGRKIDSVLEALEQDKEIKHYQNIFLMAVPDKYNNIPLMKLGVQQTFEYTLKKKNLEVFSPLRILSNANSTIELTRVSKNDYLLKAKDVIFYCEGKSRETGNGAVIKSELEGVQLIIKNYEQGSEKISSAEIILDSKYNNYVRYFFDGSKFVPAGF
jgi:hypothetical protein